MIYSDQKVSKNKNKRYGGCILQVFIRNVPSKLEIQCKKGLYFSTDFGWYTIHLDIVH